jgi:hypothetical protein
MPWCHRYPLAQRREVAETLPRSSCAYLRRSTSAPEASSLLSDLLGSPLSFQCSEAGNDCGWRDAFGEDIKARTTSGSRSPN